MAKILNPLFSIAASGCVGLISFNTGEKGIKGRVRPLHPHPKPTPAQTLVRNNCKLAAAAWNALTDDERDQWAGRGLIIRFSSDSENITVLHNGWALWLAEWNLQQAHPGRLPLIPT